MSNESLAFHKNFEVASEVLKVKFQPQVTREQLIQSLDRILTNVYGCAGCGLNGKLDLNIGIDWVSTVKVDLTRAIKETGVVDLAFERFTTPVIDQAGIQQGIGAIAK